MTAPVPPTQLKLAERLTILNDRLTGVLTRLHYMKSVLALNECRPKFMPGVDKTFDAAWKSLLKKFPNTDVKSNNSSLQPFVAIHKEILTQLGVYYYNLVDVLEVKDHFVDLLGRISANHIQMDITLNFELTKGYLDLVSNHFAMMMLLSKIEVKQILALYNLAYEAKNSKSENHFPRMSERLVEQADTVLRNLHKDLNPYAKTLTSALRSVGEFFNLRTLRAQNWSDGHFLNLLNDSTKLVHTVLTDRMACELLTVEVMERWIVFGYIMIYPELANDDAFTLWKTALRNSYAVVLFRDEVVHIHTLLIQFFESIRNFNKRVSEVRDFNQAACTQAPEIHRDRRSYLRVALRELCLILSDEPGLLGPKSFLVFWGLSYACDEINWLLRHSANLPPKKTNFRVNVEHFTDRSLSELLFYIEELRNLIIRYTQVIQRFYIQTLSGYDAPGLQNMIQDIMPRLQPEDAAIFNFMIQQLLQLDVDQIYTDHLFDFSGVRLDWFRVQSYLSGDNSQVNLSEHRRLVGHINSTIFHTKMVDFLDEMLRECSDLSMFYFYQQLLGDYFKNSIQLSSQLRYSIVFPILCTHFTNACHDLCPEEKPVIGSKSARIASKFCHEISDQVCRLIIARVDEFANLSFQLLPHKSTPWLPLQQPKKKGKGGTQHADKKGGNNSIAAGDKTLPGVESFRRCREQITITDKSLLILSQFCFALNYRRELIVWEKTFNPREILHLDIEEKLCDALREYTMITAVPDRPEESVIVKPSELLCRVRAQMSAVVNLDNHLCIDLVRVFNNVFLQHTQARDSHKGHPTITAHYTRWYMECLLRFAYKDQFVYSPLLKSFVTMPNIETSVNFRAEDYADLSELRALAELLGPYGIRYLCERLMQEVGNCVDELKKLVLQNKTTLESLRESFDNPGKTRQLTALLQNTDTLLHLLKVIGIGVAFKNLCLEALFDVLKNRVPFLMSSVHELRNHMSRQWGPGSLLGMPATAPAPTNHTNPIPDDPTAVYARFNDQLVVNDLSAAMGISAPLDATLCSVLQGKRLQGGPADQDYQVSCLLVVFVANALPRLARNENSLYHVELEAHENNIHCIAYAINALMAAMFTLRPGELEARSKEFLALASTNLLRLGLETSMLASDGGGGGLGSVSGLGVSSGTVSGAGVYGGGGGGANLPPAKHRDSVYILFDSIVRHSPCLTADLQEACFPYALVSSAYHNVAKMSRSVLVSAGASGAATGNATG